MTRKKRQDLTNCLAELLFRTYKIRSSVGERALIASGTHVARSRSEPPLGPDSCKRRLIHLDIIFQGRHKRASRRL